MNDSINRDNTIAESMNDNINRDNTITESMNDNINRDNTIAESRILVVNWLLAKVGYVGQTIFVLRQNQS